MATHIPPPFHGVIAALLFLHDEDQVSPRKDGDSSAAGLWTQESKCPVGSQSCTRNEICAVSSGRPYPLTLKCQQLWKWGANSPSGMLRAMVRGITHAPPLGFQAYEYLLL